MARYVACMLVFMLCVAIVGAEGPRKNALTAAEQARVFHRNRTMILSLVNSSVDMATNGNDYLKRSKTYSDILDTFHEEILSAAHQEDAGRVAELGRHLGSVIEKGLTPNLKEASRQIPRNGSSWDNLKNLQRQTLDTLESLRGAAHKKWPETPEAREIIQILDKARGDIHQSVAE